MWPFPCDGRREEGVASQRPSSSDRWKRARPIVKSFLGALLHGATELSDPVMTLHLCRTAGSMLPYFAAFPKFLRVLLKVAVKAWTGNDDALRVQAFLLIRSLALQMPFPFIEAVFKVGLLLCSRRLTASEHVPVVCAQREVHDCEQPRVAAVPRPVPC